jgi:hypothetical protein
VRLSVALWNVTPRRLNRAFMLLEIPMLDYLIAGESVTSLRQQRVI